MVFTHIGTPTRHAGVPFFESFQAFSKLGQKALRASSSSNRSSSRFFHWALPVTATWFELWRRLISLSVQNSFRHFVPALRPGVRPDSQTYYFWDENRKWKQDKLLPGQEDFPVEQIVNDTMLRTKIEKGWYHRDAL